MRPEMYSEGRREPSAVVGYAEAGNAARGRVGVRRDSPAGRGGETRDEGENGEVFSSQSPRRSSANADAKASSKANANANVNFNAKASAKTSAKANCKADAKADAKTNAKAHAKTNAKTNAKANASANAYANANAEAGAFNAFANANANSELSAGFRSSSEHWPETHASDDGDSPVGRWVEDGGLHYSSSNEVAGGANDGELDEAKDATWGALVRSNVERSETALGYVKRALPPENKGHCQEQGEAWREDSRAPLGRGTSPKPVGRASWTPRSTRQAALLMRGAVR